MARVLHLTNDQFGALYDIVKDAADYIEGDLITIEDENGNEVLEDINEYEIYQVFQQLQLLNNEIAPSKVTITDDDYADKVDTFVGNMVASDDNNTDKVYPEVDDVPDNIKKEWLYDYTHDSEGC